MATTKTYVGKDGEGGLPPIHRGRPSKYTAKLIDAMSQPGEWKCVVVSRQCADKAELASARATMKSVRQRIVRDEGGKVLPLGTGKDEWEATIRTDRARMEIELWVRWTPRPARAKKAVAAKKAAPKKAVRK